MAQPAARMEGLRLTEQNGPHTMASLTSRAPTGPRVPPSVPSSRGHGITSHGLPVSPSGPNTPINHWIKSPGFLA